MFQKIKPKLFCQISHASPYQSGKADAGEGQTGLAPAENCPTTLKRRSKDIWIPVFLNITRNFQDFKIPL